MFTEGLTVLIRNSFILVRLRFFPANRQRVRAREPVSFWWENGVRRRHFTTRFCENSVVAKTSPRNVGDLVFWNHKGLSYHHSKQLHQVCRHKEHNEASCDNNEREQLL